MSREESCVVKCPVDVLLAAILCETENVEKSKNQRYQRVAGDTWRMWGMRETDFEKFAKVTNLKGPIMHSSWGF